VRIVFFCSLMLILLGATFSQTIPNTDTTQYYNQGSLQIQRNLIVKPAGFVSSTTGAALEKYESIVTIIIRNSGADTKANLVVIEDLTYVPPNSKVTFNTQPKINRNYARWEIGDIVSGQSIHLRFSTPAIISESAFNELDAPSVEYTRNPATIEVSQKVELGSSINISLKNNRGVGISSGFIQVKYPDSEVKIIETDSYGNVRIIAQQIGTYSFSAPDYSVTPKIARVTAIQKPVAPDKPKNNQTAQPEQTIDVSKAFFEFWYLVAIPIALILAYLGYRYLTTPLDEDDEPIPPAPATRPQIIEASSKKDTYGEEDEQKPVEPYSQPAQSQNEDTHSLISKRRNAQKEQPPQQEFAKEETDSGTHQIEKFLNKSEEDDEEENRLAIVHGDEAEHKENMGRKNKQPQNSEIDEDAIRKTIEELEQLREELKGGSSAHEENDEDVEEDKKDAPFQSIVRKARDSEREKVINEDIGQLLDENKKDAPILVPSKGKRGRVVKIAHTKKVSKVLSRIKMPKPKAGVKKPAKAQASKKTPLKIKASAKTTKKTPGRPKKKRGVGRPPKKK